MEFSVRVVSIDDDGDETPVSGEEVKVFDNRHFWSLAWLEATTDDDGVAYFDCDWQVGEWDGNVLIYVGNNEGVEYTVNDGYQFTIPYEYD